MKQEILKSMAIINSVSQHTDIIDMFAKNEYNKKFSDIPTPYNTFHFYTGFEVLSDFKLRIKYSYGAGEHEYYDSFFVNLDTSESNIREIPYVPIEKRTLVQFP